VNGECGGCNETIKRCSWLSLPCFLRPCAQRHSSGDGRGSCSGTGIAPPITLHHPLGIRSSSTVSHSHKRTNALLMAATITAAQAGTAISTPHTSSSSYVAGIKRSSRPRAAPKAHDWCSSMPPLAARRARACAARAAEGALLGGVTAPVAQQLRISVGDREVSGGSAAGFVLCYHLVTTHPGLCSPPRR
jgi:hypothetical protein